MINILPLNDLKKHIESSICECNPRVEFENGEMIIIHNSYDGREWIEDLSEEQLRLPNVTPTSLSETIKEKTQLFIDGFNKKELSINDLIGMLKQAEIEEKFEVAISLRDAVNAIKTAINNTREIQSQ